MHFFKISVCVLGNHFAPKGPRWAIALFLSNTPLAPKHIEDAMSYFAAHSTPAILYQDEDFGNGVSGLLVSRVQKPDEHKPGQLARHSHQEWVAARFRPIIVEVAVAKKPVLVYIVAVELAVIVLAQFQQIAKDGLVAQRSRSYRNVHL